MINLVYFKEKLIHDYEKGLIGDVWSIKESIGTFFFFKKLNLLGDIINSIL